MDIYIYRERDRERHKTEFNKYRIKFYVKI